MTTFISGSTNLTLKAPSISLIGAIQSVFTANVGISPKSAVSVKLSRSKINPVMITDASGSETLSPKALEDDLDRQIAAMTLEEHLAMIESLFGSWADRSDITVEDGHVNLDGWDFEDLTDLYDTDLPV